MADDNEQLADPQMWEIDALLGYCNVGGELLDKIGYSVGSVFAASLYTVSRCPRLQLLGESLEEEMEIREWVEFYCSKLRSPSPWIPQPKERLNSCLEVLNNALADRIYLTGTVRLSVADLLIFYGLHYYMKEASYSDKMAHVHLSRWFDQVQHSPNVKPFTWQWIQFPKT